MMVYVYLAIGLGLLGFLGYRGGRVWLDVRQRHLPAARRVSLALVGAIAPDRYWWRARIETLSQEERDDLLARETAALGLSRADSVRCPLCSAEVPHAWTLTADGEPTVAPGPVECPHCDFRLDACRHCAHFLPGSTQGVGTSPWIRGDMGSGRCNRFRSSQAVEQVCTPDMARRLKARGYEQIRAPLPILDSFLPPDSCRAYAAERRRLKEGGIRWPDARRTALLRLLAAPAAHETAPLAELSPDDAQWLL